MAVPSKDGRLPRAERRSAGEALRKQGRRASHAGWKPGRRDPIAILRQDDQDRLEELLPIRYGRMHGSPLAFLRGSCCWTATAIRSSCRSRRRVPIRPSGTTRRSSRL